MRVAQTNGGGLTLWGSDGSLGKLRTSDETYHQAWLPWIQEIGAIIARNQITNGGPVILEQLENELQQTRYDPTNTLVVYMEQLDNATKEAGIVVPTMHNEKGQRSVSWSTDYMNVGGAVNLYGLDSYPGGLSCTNINSGFNLVRNYYQWFQNYSYTQPEFFPEFESGWFQPWGGYFYDQCMAEHDPAFADVYYKNNIGQRATLMNLYMAFGGTNWGNLGAPVVYTSYDYSSPLRETREVQLKFKQSKLIALFTRNSRDLRKTDMESNGTGNAVSSTDIYSWVLRNPDNSAGFYTLQHSASNSRAVTNFHAYLNTSFGVVNITNVQLNGRQSKILTTDYHFGDSTLLYSSADVLTYGIFDEKPVLVLYLQAGQVGEFAFPTSPSAKVVHGTAKVTESSGHSDRSSESFTRFTYTQTSGTSVITFTSGVKVYLLDTETAWNFFAPPTTTDPNVSADEQIFVIGPYNVRKASISAGTVSVVGDNANTTSIEVYAGSSAKSITWNGQALKTTKSAYGSLLATAPGATDRAIELPTLSWVVSDSFPEAARSYDDKDWVICNKSTTLSTVKPLTLPVLFSSDYGYYAGIKIYRGYFDSAAATGGNITAQGGVASGWSAWLNGAYVGGSPGNASLSATSAILDFSKATKYNSSNVLTIVTDYTGHDQTSTGPSGVENPRGILGATLLGNSNGTSLEFTQWKIQGQAGGSQANIDPVRGPMNEDGLYGTRLGWHLPGFKPTGPEWSPGSPLTGLATAGIKWYTAHFDLSLDSDLDVPLGIELGAPAGTIASVQLYVNGYQCKCLQSKRHFRPLNSIVAHTANLPPPLLADGKFIPQIGPQTRFPFPPGVVNSQGSNTIAIALWAQTEAGAKLSNATLFAYGKYQTGFDFSQDWSSLQPQWTEDRLQYA